MRYKIEQRHSTKTETRMGDWAGGNLTRNPKTLNPECPKTLWVLSRVLWIPSGAEPDPSRSVVDRFFFPWPYQPHQCFDCNPERVALMRRLPEDDQFVAMRLVGTGNVVGVFHFQLYVLFL